MELPEDHATRKATPRPRASPFFDPLVVTVLAVLLACLWWTWRRAEASRADAVESHRELLKLTRTIANAEERTNRAVRNASSAAEANAKQRVDAAEIEAVVYGRSSDLGLATQNSHPPHPRPAAAKQQADTAVKALEKHKAWFAAKGMTPEGGGGGGSGGPGLRGGLSSDADIRDAIENVASSEGIPVVHRLRSPTPTLGQRRTASHLLAARAAHLTPTTNHHHLRSKHRLPGTPSAAPHHRPYPRGGRGGENEGRRARQ